MSHQLNHIGIAVPDLEAAKQTYLTMGFPLDKVEEVPSQKVRVAFFAAGASHLELLEPTSEDSPIAKFLQSRGAGIHHICVEVDDIDATLAAYKEAGIRLINESAVPGAGGHRVAFVHPKATGGVLLELMETNKENVLS